MLNLDQMCTYQIYKYNKIRYYVYICVALYINTINTV